jgi:hypothetical protein
VTEFPNFSYFRKSIEMAKKKSYTQQIRDLFEQGKSAENIVTALGVPSQQVHNVRWHLKNRANKEL